MWTSRQEIEGDDEFALKQIVDICIERKADLFLLGDTLDAVTNFPRPMVILKKHLDRLVKAGHTVKFIQGQHEMVVAMDKGYPWLSLIDGTEHVHEKSFEFLGRQAYALDYFPEAFQELQLAKVPEGTEVLFLHGTAQEIVPFNAHFSMDNVPESCVVFAGDYHEPIAYKHEANSAGLYYTGSMHQRSANEPREKSVIAVNEDLATERIPLKTRKLVFLSEVESGGSDLEPLNDLPAKLRKPVLLVDRPFEKEEAAEWAKQAHVYITPAADPDIPNEEDIEQREDQSDAEILERYADKEKYPVEYQFTLDVIQNPVSDALERLVETLEVQDLVRPQEDG